MNTAFFMSQQQVNTIRTEFGTPVYVYDQKTLEAAADQVLAFPNAFGLTARYAMKALPTTAVVRLFAEKASTSTRAADSKLNAPFVQASHPNVFNSLRSKCRET